MDITLTTDIAGYFSYKIYRENPDNIIYESPTRKNLIVDSGLKHLYSLSVPDAIQILDLGNSSIPVSPGDTKLKGSSFPNAAIFNDLAALNQNTAFDSINSILSYTLFFRTRTASSPTVLKEFVIKPGPNTDAFARQVFAPLTLQAGDGVEFTYNVQVSQPCAPHNTKLKLFYDKRIIGQSGNINDEQLPLVWQSVPSPLAGRFWCNIDSNNSTIVVVGAAPYTIPGTSSSSIVYSTDLGKNWEIATTPEDATYSIKSLNDVAIGYIIDDAGAAIDKYVAVGLDALYYSDTGAVWLSGTPADDINWTGISFGEPSNSPIFVAVANTGSNRIMRSSDTVNWSIVDSPITNSIDWSAIVHGGNYFVAVADSGSHRIAYSTNGATWLSAASPAQNAWCDIAYNSDRDIYVAVSRNAPTYSSIMYASGSNMNKWYPARPPFIGSWNGITYGNGVFVAVGTNNVGEKGAIYSRDGINWLPVTIPNGSPWKAVSFSNNTFVAVASSTSIGSNAFARSEVKPLIGGLFEIDSKISQISITDRVYNQQSYMYTLRDFDMPLACSMSPANAENLSYSTTLPYNSYVKATTNLISPNTAVSIYKFNETIGHGVIKNLLITDNILNAGYKTPGLWAIELNADPQLADPVVYTGTLNNIVTLSPEPGSITRSISSSIGNITKSELQINVYHTWGPNRPIITSSSSIISNNIVSSRISPIDIPATTTTPNNTPTTTTTTTTTPNNIPPPSVITPEQRLGVYGIDGRPYADAILLSWGRVLASESNYNQGYYGDFVTYDDGIFPDNIEFTGQACDTTIFKFKNAIHFELKSNYILPTISNDIISQVYLPTNSKITYNDMTRQLSNTINSETSAAVVAIYNENVITEIDIINNIRRSVAASNIPPDFIQDVQFHTWNGQPVLRLIFNKNSKFIPDYINVITPIIDLVDPKCMSYNGGYLGLGPSTIISRFDVIRPS